MAFLLQSSNKSKNTWSVLAALVALSVAQGLHSPQGKSVLGVHHGHHDSNIAVAVDGQMTLVLPLSYVFRWPHLGKLHLDEFVDGLNPWNKTFHCARRALGSLGVPEIAYDYVVIPERPPFTVAELGPLLFQHRKVVSWPHHAGHATYALYDSPFTTPLVVTMDGGDEARLNYFNMYLGDKRKPLYKPSRRVHRHIKLDSALTLLLRVAWNFGVGFENIGRRLEEVASLCSGLNAAFSCLAATLMDYSTLGRPQPELMQFLRHLLQSSGSRQISFLMKMRERFAIQNSTTALQRDFAASAQRVLEESVLMHLQELVLRHTVDGVVLAGGVASNTLLVTAIQRRTRLPIHVPVQPTDAALGVGFVYSVLTPSVPPQVTALGPPLPDGADLPSLAKAHGGVACSPRDVAALLARGFVVAVVRGRQPITDRSLGTRTLLAAPSAAAFAARTRRSPFSPVPCFVPAERMQNVSQDGVVTSNVPTAAAFRPAWARRFPHLVDGHGAGRIMSISMQQDPWLHQVLLRIGEAVVQSPVLMHASFALNGTVVSTVKMALDAFHEDSLIQYLVIEDFLFERAGLG